MFDEKVILGQHRERTAGRLAPLVANQIAACRNLEIGFLRDRIGAGGIFHLRFDDARAVLLLHGEGFGGDALSSDKNAERTRVDGLGAGTGFLFLVRFVGGGRRQGKVRKREDRKRENR